VVKRKAKISAPGKLIISGEHSVVYGYPAIVSAINRRLVINAEYKVDSDIPIGCGMGSSAAYAVALAGLKMRLNGKLLDQEKICSQAYTMEKQRHGNPSGVDNTVCTYGGVVWYRKEVENFKTFSKINARKKLPTLLIHNTGQPAETTKDMVQMVGKLYKKSPKRIDRVWREMEEVTRGFLKFLMGEGGDLLELISENERRLEELAVVSQTTKTLVNKIEQIGGAAKISGAGGKHSNSGIILLYHADMEKLKHFLGKNKLETFQVKMGEEGVRDEK